MLGQVLAINRRATARCSDPESEQKSRRSGVSPSPPQRRQKTFSRRGTEAQKGAGEARAAGPRRGSESAAKPEGAARGGPQAPHPTRAPPNDEDREDAPQRAEEPPEEGRGRRTAKRPRRKAARAHTRARAARKAAPFTLARGEHRASRSGDRSKATPPKGRQGAKTAEGGRRSGGNADCARAGAAGRPSRSEGRPWRRGKAAATERAAARGERIHF